MYVFFSIEMYIKVVHVFVINILTALSLWSLIGVSFYMIVYADLFLAASFNAFMIRERLWSSELVAHLPNIQWLCAISIHAMLVKSTHIKCSPVLFWASRLPSFVLDEQPVPTDVIKTCIIL